MTDYIPNGVTDLSEAYEKLRVENIAMKKLMYLAILELESYETFDEKEQSRLNRLIKRMKKLL